jgi:hypothetical protein
MNLHKISFTVLFAWVCSMVAFATNDVATESIGRAYKVRSDAAILTPAVGSWNSDGAPGNFGTYWYASGTSGYTANYQFPTNAGAYDLYLQIKTGPALTTSLPVTVSFLAGGAYELSPDERLTSVNAANAASGSVTYTMDTSGPTWPNTAFVYLGRFTYAAAGTGSVMIHVDQAAGPGDTHIPVTLWAAETTTNYGTMAYNDYNSVPSGWFSSDSTEFPHYYANTTANTDVFRTSQYFGFPETNRTTGTTGVYRVNFTHFTIWHGQAQGSYTNAIIYFKPGGLYTLPTVGGFVSAVDSTNAAQGRVTVSITWPSTTASGPPYPQNTFSLGEYEFDNVGKMYGLKLNNFPAVSAGETYQPKYVSLSYISVPVELSSFLAD